MGGVKTGIINRLQRDILALQEFSSLRAGYPVLPGELSVMEAFSDKTFSLGTVHEFVSGNMEDAGATAEFVSGLISTVL